MWIRAIRHAPVVELVVLSQGHYSYIPESAKTTCLGRVGGRYFQYEHIAFLWYLHIPSGFPFHLHRMDGQYSVKRRFRHFGSRSNDRLKTIFNRSLWEHLDIDSEVLHVNQVLPQSLQIDFAPIRFRIGIEFPDCFLDCPERIIARGLKRSVNLLNALHDHHADPMTCPGPRSYPMLRTT